MTPRQIVTIDFLEIGKVEITCKCGAVLVFPIPQQKGQEYPPHSYACLACHETLWNDVHDERYTRLYPLVDALARWKGLEDRSFNLSFSLVSN